MERFVKGDVVALDFPFVELDRVKRRPALVLAPAGRDDLIVCMITSRPPADKFAVGLAHSDFLSGSSRKQSFIRANRIFTVTSSVINRRIGAV